MKHDIEGMKALAEQLKEEAFKLLQAGYEQAALRKIGQADAIENEIKQLANTNNHGGPRPGAGRKKKDTNRSVHIQFKISPKDEEALRALMTEEDKDSINKTAQRLLLQAISCDL